MFRNPHADRFLQPVRQETAVGISVRNGAMPSPALGERWRWRQRVPYLCVVAGWTFAAASLLTAGLARFEGMGDFVGWALRTESGAG